MCSTVLAALWLIRCFHSNPSPPQSLILEAYNRHGLVVFLAVSVLTTACLILGVKRLQLTPVAAVDEPQANLFTGIVNFSVDTLAQDAPAAIAILMLHSAATVVVSQLVSFRPSA